MAGISKYGNHIDEVRPTSTFKSFIPQTDEQAMTAQGLEKLTTQIGERLRSVGEFDHARVVGIHGGPGRGKTHLTEAMINRLREMEVADRVWLVRGEDAPYALKQHALSEDATKRVFIVDDLFSRFPALARVDTWNLGNFTESLLQIYERRLFLITTSNFSTAGIKQRITADIDPVGRVKSRLAEMTVRDITLDGPDYREILAQQRNENEGGDPYAL